MEAYQAKVHGVAAIIFAEKDGQRKFLILHRILHWKGWEFVKGHIDPDETEEQAVLREVEEETGLKKVEIFKKLHVKLDFEDRLNNVFRTNNVYLVKADMSEHLNMIQEKVEHDQAEWVDEETALEKLTFNDLKEVFAAATAELQKVK